MAVSAAVRAYYTQHVFLESGRDRVPRNFRPIEGGPVGRSVVEGCAGGGKNVLEVFVRGDGDRVGDVRASCGLCNPAMYVAADVVCDWSRGRPLAEVLATDPLDRRSLAPLYERLGGPGRPDDAREKFQYALIALQNAVRALRGDPLPPPPAIAPPTDEDLDDLEEPPWPCASTTR
jgi:hypothetical protein